MSKWIPIPKDAMTTKEAPYDGNSYDVWFKTPHHGRRFVEVEWSDCFWIDITGDPLKLMTNQTATHYMVPPEPPD